VDNWLADWTRKDIRSYIGHYHSDFRFDGMNLKEFEEYKSRLAARYSRISIGVDKLTIEIDGGQARVSYIQDFKSDQYSDYGLKTLVMERQGDDWRIRSESWRDMRAGAKP
jgi:ketosteroid isomerase-like protein